MNHKALIVRDSQGGLIELNKHLAEGWTVLQTCPMPSSPASYHESYSSTETSPTCLVIIGKHGLLPKAP